MDDPPLTSIALHGPSFIRPGEVELRELGDRSACSISVGTSRAIARKKPEAAPNEDSLYLYEDGEHAIHVVADGHYGVEASRELVNALGEIFDAEGPGVDPAQAFGQMALAWRGRPDQGISRSTVVIAHLDRRAARVTGVSIGDSACFLVGSDGVTMRLDTPSRHYAAPWDYYSLGLQAESHFRVPVAPGSCLLSCTDGILECHYGQPDQSVQPEDIGELFSLAGSDVSAAVADLGALALRGVRDHSGGEDNFAITASLA